MQSTHKLMVLRLVIFLLAICSSLSSVKAMEKEGVEKVTVRLWKTQKKGNTAVEGHISLQTKKNYMSLRPYDHILNANPGESRYATSLGNYFNEWSFAAATPEVDQMMQNERLGWRWKNGCLDKETFHIWPCETFTINLEVELLDQWWEKLLKTKDLPPITYFENTPQDSKTRREKLQGYRLAKVCYWDKPLKEIIKNKNWTSEQNNYYHHFTFSQKGSELDFNKYYQSDKFYLSNATLMKGFLVMGRMQKHLPEHWLENPTYFKDHLGCTPIIQFPYDDIFVNNSQIRQDDLTVNELADWFLDLLRRPELIHIHNEIVRRNMFYLNTEHEKEILDIFMEENSLETNVAKILIEYLPTLQRRYNDQQSYFSKEGWVDYFYTQEWKKEDVASIAKKELI